MRGAVNVGDGIDIQGDGTVEALPASESTSPVADTVT